MKVFQLKLTLEPQTEQDTTSNYRVCSNLFEDSVCSTYFHNSTVVKPINMNWRRPRIDFQNGSYHVTCTVSGAHTYCGAQNFERTEHTIKQRIPTSPCCARRGDQTAPTSFGNSRRSCTVEAVGLIYTATDLYSTIFLQWVLRFVWNE